MNTVSIPNHTMHPQNPNAPPSSSSCRSPAPAAVLYHTTRYQPTSDIRVICHGFSAAEEYGLPPIQMAGARAC
jgi:hypothetical protein